MDTQTPNKKQDWLRKWCVLARALLLASDIPLCHAVPSQGWIGWQTHYPSVTAEWVRRGLEHEGGWTGQPLWRRLEVLKSFILKVRLMTPLIHVWATAEEDRAEFVPAVGYSESAAHTHEVC